MNAKFRLFSCVLFAAALAQPAPVHGTDIATGSLRPDLLGSVNVIFGLDDSTSMDFEMILPTNDGAMWWDAQRGNGWGVDAAHPMASMRKVSAPWFNAAGIPNEQWRKFVYLFPNGLGDAHRVRPDILYAHFAALPTTEFAYLRSSAHNPLYYDPSQTYTPWARAQLATGPAVPVNADPRAVLSHPVIRPTGGLSATIDLTSVLSADTRDNFTFTALPGMRIPGGASKQVCGQINLPSTCGPWIPVPATETVAAGELVRVAVAYRPATYWVKQDCVPEARDLMRDLCARAPDGTTLKRYEIRPSVTFPSGRSYTDEMRNFANWFQYFRKRKLILASAMGRVLEPLRGMRFGVVEFNNRADTVMYDSDSTDPNRNARRVAGLVYETPVGGTTPTRETLDFIGRQFRRTDRDAAGRPAIVQQACQRNNAFILTDGYATWPAPDLHVVPWDSGTSAATWVADVPYQGIFPDSLADIASRHYTDNPQPAMPLGRVASTERDTNNDLHVNTYALSIGARGTMFTDEDSVPPTLPDQWPDPSVLQHPYSIDDLWHATLNGRGEMYTASNGQDLALRIQHGLQEMLSRKASQSSLTVSSVNLVRADGSAYRATYNPNGWSGDVVANGIDKATGAVDSKQRWSLAQRVKARGWDRRTIVSHDGVRGVPFSWTALAASRIPGLSAGTIDYLRGSRAGEGSAYRERTGIIGGAVNARPVVSSRQGVVYAATGEGMLHAIDSATGDELWAYAPHSALADMAASTRPDRVLHSTLDGTPTLVDDGSTAWILGGRGAAGAGYYAVDVSNPRGLSEAARAATVMWEFPNAATPLSVKATLGVALGRPVVAKTRTHGQVVLVTSGYNSPARDGRGRVFMLEAKTGKLLQTFEADAGTRGEDPGLAQLSALAEDDGKARYAYAGDEKGNLWRFDLEATKASDAVVRLAILKDAGGRAQPVTTAPELAMIGTDRTVLVGTGRLLAASDFESAAVQSFYAIKDGPPLDDARLSGKLMAQRLGDPDSAGRRRLIGDTADPKRQRGWYFDLPAGQQVNTDPALAFGAVAFVANTGDTTQCTSASYLYAADVATGVNVAGREWAMEPIARQLASGVVILSVDRGGSGVSTVGDITTADNRVVRKSLQPIAGIAPRKNAWRLVNRQ